MAPTVRKSWIPYLSNLIAEFLEIIADYTEEHGSPCKLHYSTLSKVNATFWPLEALMVHAVRGATSILQETCQCYIYAILKTYQQA